MEEIAATVKKNAENAQQANALTAGTPRGRRSRRPGRGQGGRRHGPDRGLLAQDLRHHRGDRRDRASDQPAGAQCRGRSGARGRCWPRLRGGRFGSAQPGAAFLAGRQGHQGPDHQLATARCRTASSSSTRPARRSPRSSSRSSRWPRSWPTSPMPACEQATGIEQVNKALTQMDEVTQQNSALVEENAATAKTLETQSATMNEQVSFFQLEGGSSVVRMPAKCCAGPGRQSAGGCSSCACCQARRYRRTDAGRAGDRAQEGSGLGRILGPA